MPALGVTEWVLIGLPWLVVLVALVLHWRDEKYGYPERMQRIKEVD